MKLTTLFLGLIFTNCVFASDTISYPDSVLSLVDEFDDQYSNPSLSITLNELCNDITNNNKNDFGKFTEISCESSEDGILALKAVFYSYKMVSKWTLTGRKYTKVRDKIAYEAVVYGNPSDILLAEQNGSLISHRYKNNLGQLLLVNLDFVNTGVKLDPNSSTTIIKGYNRITIKIQENVDEKVKDFGFYAINLASQ